MQCGNPSVSQCMSHAMWQCEAQVNTYHVQSGSTTWDVSQHVSLAMWWQDMRCKSTHITCSVAMSTTCKLTWSRDGLSPNSAVEKTPTTMSHLSSLLPCFSFPPTFHLFPLSLLPMANILLCSMVLQAIDHSSLFVLIGIKQVFFYSLFFCVRTWVQALFLFSFLFLFEDCYYSMRVVCLGVNLAPTLIL